MNVIARFPQDPTPADDLARRLAGSAYQGYAYTYPHKIAYAPLDPPRALADVWADEHKRALELYVHVPFCAMRCGFCNLFTTVNSGDDVVVRMLSQLAVEAAAAAEALAHVPAKWTPVRRQEHAPTEESRACSDSEGTEHALGAAQFARIAIGGGTPTFLAPDQLDALFDILDRTFAARPAQISTSIEASPETVTAEKLAVLRQRGVQRLSIGVQSFVDGETRALGRPQRRAQVEAALDLVAAAAFPTFNIDLIYGAAGQSVASWRASIDAALAWQPDEIFLYPLYVRPLTGLARLPAAAAAPDIRLDLYRAGRERLLAAGFTQIDMRCFRRPRDGTANDASNPATTDGTLGLGCGARSRTSRLHYSSEYAVGRAGVKEILAAYLSRPPASFGFAHFGVALSPQDRRRERVLLDLLHTAGLSRRGYRDTFGADALDDLPQLAALEQLGLARIDTARIRLTEAGLERADVIGPWLYAAEIATRMERYRWR
jgi:oxygen-independent coproporphyrinogen III oxidase